MATIASKISPKMGRSKDPVLDVTQYDRVSSSMIAIVIGLVVAAIWLGVVWLTNRIPQGENVAPLELLELSGGKPDGALDETLNVESPEPETQDPSVAEEVDEQTEITEMLEQVVELSDRAAEQVQQQFDAMPVNTGNPGSKQGTGRHPLGMGPGEGGFPREKRWFTRFAGGSLAEYAKQLSHFGIVLGVLTGDGKLHYMTKLTADKPTIRTVTSGKGERRLYMTWRGGNRRKSDIKLFRKAGIDAGGALIIHFYPAKLETQLASLERKYQNQNVEKIRRTYFLVRGSREGYQFVVTKQLVFR